MKRNTFLWPNNQLFPRSAQRPPASQNPNPDASNVIAIQIENLTSKTTFQLQPDPNPTFTIRRSDSKTKFQIKIQNENHNYKSQIQNLKLTPTSKDQIQKIDFEGGSHIKNHELCWAWCHAQKQRGGGEQEGNDVDVDEVDGDDVDDD